MKKFNEIVQTKMQTNVGKNSYFRFWSRDAFMLYLNARTCAIR